MFYPVACGSRTARSPRRTALNRVKGMPFAWSLNPYTGCAHRCTFCYVRAFEARADRPRTTATAVRSASRSTSPRSCARSSRALLEAGERRRRRCHRPVPAGRGRATGSRAPASASSAARATPFSLITRGPLARRDADVLAEAAVARRCTSPSRCRPSTSGSGAPPSPARRRRDDGSRPCGSSPTRGSTRGVALAPLLPGLSDDPELLAEVVREARAAGASGVWANVLYLRPGTREHFLEALARDWPELLPTYERPLRQAGRTCRRPRPTRPGRSCAGLARERWRQRRPTLRPEPAPEQLRCPPVGTVFRRSSNRGS